MTAEPITTIDAIRRTNAGALYELLNHDGEVAATGANLHYDGHFTVTAGPVQVAFTPWAVEVTFPDPYCEPDEDSVTVTITGQSTYGALCTTVAGLVTQVVPIPVLTELSTVRTRLVELHHTYDRLLDDEHADRQHLLESLLHELYLLADDLGDQEES